jgi:tetratricopeptide (TPR) repeat protein
MKAERFYWPASWVLAIAVIATHVLGAGSLGPALWGAHPYAFLPRAALAAAGALLAVVLALGIASPGRADRALRALPRPIHPPTPATRLRTALTIGGFFLAFWLFREGHTLLGDGSPLSQDLPLGKRFHPYEPLTFLFHHWFYGLAQGLFSSGDRAAEDVARATVGLSSAIAGALFVPVAWGLARELSRTVEPDPADAPVATPDSVVALAFLVLLAQGYVQLFFGYVENYTLVALGLGAYFLASLRHLRGAAPLALPGVALVLAIGLDLSAFLLLPSFLILVARSLATPGQRLRALRDLALAGLVATAITALMATVERDYNLASAVYGVALRALAGPESHSAGLAYMFSSAHVRDFLNEQMLIGPAAAFLLVAGVLWLALARARLTWAVVFFLAAGVVSLGAAWVTSDLKLGYPRDWDLFAPSGLAFTAAGLYLLLSTPWRGASVRRCLALLALVSLFHTLPWIAINASFDRSFARFKTLPTGLGRTEAVVGLWYLSHGDTVQAIPWFQRSLHAYPSNNIAAYTLGQIGMRRGMYRWAAQGFWTALQSRPDKDNYRFALVDAILRGGGPPQWAKAHLDTLLRKNPGEPVYWAAYGVVHLGLAERDRAAFAFQRARQLAPEDSSIRRLPVHLSQPDGYERAIREDWPAIVGP